LIADDSGVFRKAVRAYLTQRNFDVCGEAIDGNDVVKKATELQPALIILDIRMPQGSAPFYISTSTDFHEAATEGARPSTPRVPARRFSLKPSHSTWIT
jgi:DNA-binding NarL/FixJ family response regulator